MVGRCLLVAVLSSAGFVRHHERLLRSRSNLSLFRLLGHQKEKNAKKILLSTVSCTRVAAISREVRGLCGDLDVLTSEARSSTIVQTKLDIFSLHIENVWAVVWRTPQRGVENGWVVLKRSPDLLLGCALSDAFSFCLCVLSAAALPGALRTSSWTHLCVQDEESCSVVRTPRFT